MAPKPGLLRLIRLLDLGTYSVHFPMNFGFGFEPIVDVVVGKLPATHKDFISTDSNFFLQVLAELRVLESNWQNSNL